ncbi:MAG: mercuric transporter MerT family protein [Steroidobacteraceae bacterium]
MSAPTQASDCSCTVVGSGSRRLARAAVAGGIFASLGICAACCLLPLVLIALGVGGAFVGAFELLAPYKWIFVTLTTAFLAWSFYAVYWKPTKCTAGRNCKSCGSSRGLRVTLWIATILAVSSLAFEYLEPLLAP